MTPDAMKRKQAKRERRRKRTPQSRGPRKLNSPSMQQKIAAQMDTRWRWMAI